MPRQVNTSLPARTSCSLLVRPSTHRTELDEAYANIQAEHEAVLGGTENGESVPNLEEGVPETPENVQNEGENVQQPMTDEQLHQYARGAFDDLPQEQIEQLQQHNQQMLEQDQQRREEEANRQPTALERVPLNEETGEPMFEKADKETALDALNEGYRRQRGQHHSHC